jgi:hypothetical protein
MTCPSSPKSSACMQGHGWPAQREVVGEKTCRAVLALLTCGSRSIRAREAVSVRGGRAAVLRGSAPHERTRRFLFRQLLYTAAKNRLKPDPIVCDT